MAAADTATKGNTVSQFSTWAAAASRGTFFRRDAE